VYSGAYADPWNYGDGTVKGGAEFDSNPVQIGDPLKGDVKYTTVKDLWAAAEYFNPMRGLSAKEETVTARFAGWYDCNFDMMPPKGNIEKSVKFASSDETVAKVDEYGNVEVLDASAEKTVTISAVSNATIEGKAKEASYTLKVVPHTQIISARELMKAIEDRELDGGNFRIIDLRAVADYDTAHIITAVSADVSGAVKETDAAAAKTNVSNAVAGDAAGTKYALICYTGNKYANAGKAILEELGVASENIFILGQDNFEQGAEGGMKGWTAAYGNFVVATEVSASDSTITTNGISAENLEAVLGSDHVPFVVMDVRAADDYKKGHIAAADNATCPSTGPDDASTAAVKALVDEYGTDAAYVACCYSGKKCADCAYRILKSLGVEDSHIIRLTGGMAAWKGDLVEE
jgi:rhodanese-related sulfurtransferase